MARRSKWFGGLAALGIVAGAFAWRHESQSKVIRQHAEAVLTKVQRGQIETLSSDAIGPGAKMSLQAFEQKKGRAERFDLGALNGIPAIGPAHLSGQVIRRGEVFGFGMLVSGDGRPTSYHEWPLAAPKE